MLYVYLDHGSYRTPTQLHMGHSIRPPCGRIGSLLEGVASRRSNAERGHTLTDDLMHPSFPIHHLNVGRLCMQEVSLKLANDRQVVMLSKGFRQSCEHMRILCASDVHDALIAHVTVRRGSIKGSLYAKRDSSMCLAVVNRLRAFLRVPVDPHSITIPMPLDIDHTTGRGAGFQLLYFLLRYPAKTISAFYTLSREHIITMVRSNNSSKFMLRNIPDLGWFWQHPYFDEHCASIMISFAARKAIAKAHKATGMAQSP